MVPDPPTASPIELEPFNRAPILILPLLTALPTATVFRLIVGAVTVDVTAIDDVVGELDVPELLPLALR